MSRRPSNAIYFCATHNASRPRSVAQHARLGYLREKAALWDARDRGDAAAEAEAVQRVVDAAGHLGMHR